jgi:serine O-acetyltransferase
MINHEFIRRKAETLSRVAEALAPTYAPSDGQNPIAPCSEVPSESEVLRVLSLLDDVFYPGYRSSCRRDEPPQAMIVERLDEVYDILCRQVARALPLRWRDKYTAVQGTATRAEQGAGERTAVRAEAERVVDAFFGQLPRLRELLKQDVVAAYRGDPAARSHSEVILSYPGLRAITTHRVAHELYLLDVPLIPRLMNEYIHRLTGIEIHPGARIGESFFIDHGTGVVIGETTVIGNRVRLYQGVTLGARSVETDAAGLPARSGKRHPTIEDDVVIYPGATILGGETVIGRGCVIGGNVWITRSVPPGQTVTLRSMEAARSGANSSASD